LNRTLIHPREVFRPAIADNSASIILVHNHSSNSDPSEEDKAVTQRLVDAGEIIGISVIDHIIISKSDYYSFAESNQSCLKTN